MVAMKNAVKGRRWGWVLRSGAGIVALLCAVSACGNGRDIESLDPRVVNGIVQRPGGEGYVDRQWVQGQLRALMLPDVQTCLRKRGREDVDADLYLGRFDEIHQTEFPPVSLYRSEGATPSMFTTGLTEEESEQEKQALECRQEVLDEGAGSVSKSIDELSDQWTVAFDEEIRRVDLDQEFADFETCLESKTGYPGESVDEGGEPDVYGFVTWWPNQHGGESMSEQDNLEGGRIFADCLDPYLEAQARATDDLRDSFIQEHLGELTTINNELTS